MHAILTQLLAVLGKSLLNLALALLAEKPLKHAIHLAASKLAKKTKWTGDDEIVYLLEDAWSLPSSKPQVSTHSGKEADSA